MDLQKTFRKGLFSLLILVPSILFSQNFTLEPSVKKISLNDIDTNYIHSLSITLTDTSNVKKIKIEIGNDSTTLNVFNETFTFDQNTFLPKNITYHRNKFIALYGFGDLGRESLFYRVSLLDSSDLIIGNPIIQKTKIF